MYWEGEKQTYVPAPQNNNNTEQQAPAAAAPGDGGPSDSLTPPGGKERKDKPKNKTAQQVSRVTRPAPPLGSRLSEWLLFPQAVRLCLPSGFVLFYVGLLSVDQLHMCSQGC